MGKIGKKGRGRLGFLQSLLGPLGSGGMGKLRKRVLGDNRRWP